MSDTALLATDFARAMSVAERGKPGPGDAESIRSAQIRLARWKSQPAFARFGQWGRRLVEDSLSEDQFIALLSEDHLSLLARCRPPSWALRLSESVGREAIPAVEQLIDGAVCRSQRACLRLAAPLIADSFLATEGVVISVAARIRCDPSLLRSALFFHLADRIETPILRALSLCVNEARLRGELSATTPDDRFDEFIHQSATEGTFFRRWPVLARHVEAVIVNWGHAARNFLEHLATDLPIILARLWDGISPGPIVALECGAGDVHRGGQSVVTLRFESGRRLVYKPRSLGAEQRFNAIVNFVNCNATPDLLDLPTVETIDLEDHGYAAFVPAAACVTVDQLRRYYRRQGQYLALLYVLDGVDIHSENLIANGEYPVLVDLETLFHPRITHRLDFDPAWHSLQHSVQRTFFVPQRIDSRDGRIGIDVSALGSRVGQLVAKPTEVVRQAATDEMRVERTPFMLPPNPGRPLLGELEVDPRQFVEDIVTGFVAMTRLLIHTRGELLAPGGPIDSCRTTRFRVIARNTSYYEDLMLASYHPPYLRDGLDRDRLFDRLYHEASFQPALCAVISSERESLWEGDVPFFSTSADSTTLTDAQGRHIHGAFEKSGYQSVRDRLERLDEDDIGRQEWLVRASFSTVALADGRQGWRSSSLRRSSRIVSVDECVARAAAIGGRLAELSVRKGALTNWLGVSLSEKGEWRVSPAESGLYDGILGITHFLAYLTVVSGSAAYRETIERALETFRAQTKMRDELGIDPQLGISGIPSSAAYVLSHLAIILGRPDLLLEAERNLLSLPSAIQSPTASASILAGHAGTLLSVLSLYEARPSSITLDLAVASGKRLLSTALPQANGVAWAPDIAANAPLTGLSHGGSGVALALSRLAAVTKGHFNAQLLEGMEQALAYEYGALGESNWLDFRSFTESPENPRSDAWMWCHGAPGIGLARAALIDGGFGKGIKHWLRELRFAAIGTATNGFGLNHSLCHGDLGNIELLRDAARILDSSRLRRAYHARLAQVADSIDREGWCCGVPLGVEVPGLFTGLAGIGFSWLRAAAPTTVPSVLVLSPPVLRTDEEGLAPDAGGLG